MLAAEVETDAVLEAVGAVGDAVCEAVAIVWVEVTAAAFFDSLLTLVFVNHSLTIKAANPRPGASARIACAYRSINGTIGQGARVGEPRPV